MELTYAGKMMVAGHRGDQSSAPENTVDMIETDVRLTKDGALVLIHDKTVDRTTDGTGAVAEMTLAQLRALNAGTADRPQPIPLLEELLALLAALAAAGAAVIGCVCLGNVKLYT